MDAPMLFEERDQTIDRSGAERTPTDQQRVEAHHHAQLLVAGAAASAGNSASSAGGDGDDASGEKRDAAAAEQQSESSASASNVSTHIPPGQRAMAGGSTSIGTGSVLGSSADDAQDGDE